MPGVSEGSQDRWEVANWVALSGSQWAGVSSLAKNTAETCRLGKSTWEADLSFCRASSGFM